MDIINRRLSIDDFKRYVQTYDFGPVLPKKLVIHHTWRPTKTQWQGQTSIDGLKGYYERKGWPAGPHLFVAEDGVWLFSPMRHDGIHAGSLNKNSIGIEVVGDYDHETWSGHTKQHAISVLKTLMQKLQLSADDIFFHREVSGKSCPGSAITKDWLLAQLQGETRPSIPTHREEDNMRLPTDDEVEVVSTVTVKVPDWAQESVNWVRRNGLFEVRSADDVRDAVKFHRLYNLIQNS